MTFRGSDILPSNASPLERLWADVKWDANGDIDVGLIRTILDPDTCPVALLPWLAWSFSVDVWDDAWPEATKRAAIKTAPEVHRLKGTRKAVRLSLAALGIEFDMVEWWEVQPNDRHGTFQVLIWAGGEGPVLNAALLESARQAVRRAKPKSRVFELALGLRASGILYAGAAARSTITLTIEAG